MTRKENLETLEMMDGKMNALKSKVDELLEINQHQERTIESLQYTIQQSEVISNNNNEYLFSYVQNLEYKLDEIMKALKLYRNE